jgi:uncharacterized protein
MKAYQLSKEEKQEIKDRISSFLGQRKEIIFAYIHGSFISANWFRDVDVAVFVDNEKVKRDDALEYQLSISSMLDKEIHPPSDVKILNYAPLKFRYEVTRGEAIFSRDDELKFNFIGETWHRYLDYQPVEREAIREILGK